MSETVNFVKPSVENAQKTNSKNETRKELSFPKNTIPVKETVVERIINIKSVRCPCCCIVLNKRNYRLHLQAHSDNQSYKILSKNLAKVETVLCPICLEGFRKTESSAFINHMWEFHSVELNSKFKMKGRNYFCNKCNSLLNGVHPAIVVQHFFGACH